MSASDHLSPQQHRVRPHIASVVGWHMPEHVDAKDAEGNWTIANEVSKGATPKDRNIISRALKTEYGLRKRDALLGKVQDPEMREYMDENDIMHEHHVNEDDFAMWQAMKDHKNNSGYDSHWEPDEREDRHLNSMWEQ